MIIALKERENNLLGGFSMKKLVALVVVLLLSITLTACGNVQNKAESKSQSEKSANTISDSSSVLESTITSEENTDDAQKPQTSTEDNGASEETEEKALKMTIGSTSVSVKWEDNESVNYLKELCRDQPVIISMSMYGGFEQVGSIGSDIPRNDVQTTTASGDIVLYSGNQLVVFYGSNSWAYTRLGHITDKTSQEMTELLSGGNVTITLSI